MSVNSFGYRDGGSCNCESGVRAAYVNNQNDLRVLKSGDTMTDNLLLCIGADSIRQLGCADLTPGKGFSLVLGNVENQLQFAVNPAENTQTPVTLETTHGFLIRSAGQNVCQFDNAVISIHRNVVMNIPKIKNLADPTEPQDAATKNYIDTKTSKVDLFRCQAYMNAAGHYNLDIAQLRSLRFSEILVRRGKPTFIKLRRGEYKVTIVGKSDIGWPGSIELKSLEVNGNNPSAGSYNITAATFNFTFFLQFLETTDIHFLLTALAGGAFPSSLNYDITIIIESL